MSKRARSPSALPLPEEPEGPISTLFPEMHDEIVDRLLTTHAGSKTAWTALWTVSRAWRSAAERGQVRLFRLLDARHLALQAALEAWRAGPSPPTTRFPWANDRRYGQWHTTATTGRTYGKIYPRYFPSLVVEEAENVISDTNMLYRPWVLSWAHTRYAGPVPAVMRAEIEHHLRRLAGGDWPATVLLGTLTEDEKKDDWSAELAIGTMDQHRFPYIVMRILSLSSRCVSSVHNLADMLSYATDELAAFLLFLSHCHVANQAQGHSMAYHDIEDILPSVMRKYVGRRKSRGDQTHSTNSLRALLIY